jgi:sulfoxide reductase heme-binding subunit YedZ
VNLAPRHLLWAFLALPALLWLSEAAPQPAADLEELLHPTGELAARLLVVALALTPLCLIFPNVRALAWLRANRRAFGLAAFGYAGLHTLFYLVAIGDLRPMLAEALAIGIWPGWAALLLMLPLALTSSDAAMRALRRGWKVLQRLAYPAAFLTLVHWMFVHGNWASALAHAVPLLLLEAWRIGRRARLQPKGTG